MKMFRFTSIFRDWRANFSVSANDLSGFNLDVSQKSNIISDLHYFLYLFTIRSTAAMTSSTSSSVIPGYIGNETVR